MNPTIGKEKQMVAMILIDDLTNDVWLFASVVGVSVFHLFLLSRTQPELCIDMGLHSYPRGEVRTLARSK